MATPRIDESLYSTLDHDPDMAGIVDLFVAEMPERLERLLENLERGDREQLHRAAHQLRGAAGSYGFHQVTPYAARLESAARDGDSLDEIRDACLALVAICRRLRAR
jgi:HPt (histidine-containing phosphotransfer) domain-containing protein